MLIKALCDYYDILAEDGLVLPEGYSKEAYHYAICLNPDGTLNDIIDIQIYTTSIQKNGKEKTTSRPKPVTVPLRTQKSGIEGNVIEHRPLYIFGLNVEKNKEKKSETKEIYFAAEDKTNKATKSHSDFVTKNLTFIDGLDSPLIEAYRKFMENWQPEAELENTKLLNIIKTYGTAKFAFCLFGESEKFLHDDPMIKQRWEEHLLVQKNQNSENEILGECAISGETLPIARLHNKIKGVLGANATGAGLVSVNNQSEESYGNTQGFNSNISEVYMKKYTETLNYLLANPQRKTHLGDVTVLNFALTQDEETNSWLAACMGSRKETSDDEKTEQWLESVLKDAQKGKLVGESLAGIDKVDKSVQFFIVGLKANSSRLSVKFIYTGTVGQLLENIAQHQIDLAIGYEPKPISMWRITKELEIPNSKTDKGNPALNAKIFEAMLYGNNYPEALLAGIIRRIKSDSDTEKEQFIKMNPTRIGILKACINRQLRNSNQQEEITMTVNEENKNPAYLCGRLFAILEKVQQKASNDNLNRTIKDAYFASAASTPALIFPKLLKLTQHHLAKVEYDYYYSREMGKIIADLVDEFPETLNLQDQGRFVIGYYQEYYKKNTKDTDDETQNQEPENA